MLMVMSVVFVMFFVVIVDDNGGDDDDDNYDSMDVRNICSTGKTQIRQFYRWMLYLAHSCCYW